MPEAAVKTRDQIAADQIQFILRQDWFQPETIRSQIQALRRLIASGETANLFSAVAVNGQQVSLTQIKRLLGRLNQALGFRIDPRLFNILNSQHLAQLEQALTEIQPPAPEPPPANIPKDLKALVAEFETAHQSAVSAQAQRQGWSPEKFREQIALQNQITIQMGVVRQATLSQLGLVIDNSQYLENLAAALGRQPEVVKRLAKIRLQTLVDQTVTAQTFRQARLISKNPSQLAALFAKNLSDNLKLDDLVDMAAAANKNDYKKAVESVKKAVTEETAKAKPAIEQTARDFSQHPSVQKSAQADAVAAVKQVKPDIPPAKAARLSTQLIKHQNNPSVQEKLVAKTFGVPPSQAKLILSSLRPSLSQLAASSKKLNPLLAADPDSIAADALRHPRLFPKPFVDAIKSGKITDAQVAEIFHTARLLNVPANAVILTKFGANAQNLITRRPKFLGFIPMGRGPDPKDASVIKLSRLADAQQQLIKSLDSPPPLFPEPAAKQFLTASRAASRRNGLSQFFDQINLFRLPSAFSYNLGRIPPLGSLGNTGSAFVSGLRVQSAPINSFFNFISSAGNTIRQTPSFLAAPLRAVGGLVNQGWQNVKTWAGTQVKSGLAKAGAWLAKKGVTKTAQKIGGAVLGKTAAGLLGAAVGGPVGWVAGALALLSSLGDIGKFLWDHKKEIGIGLGGMFLLGQLLLGKLLGLLGSAAWTLGGAALGFMIGGPIGAAVGGLLGYLIGSGALSSAIAGLGTWLGSAAAGLSSFIGALTAPSAFIGLGSTVATAGLLGVAAAWFLQTFFIQPNINSALFVPSEKSLSTPGGGGIIPPDIVAAGTCPLVENPSISAGTLGSGLGRAEHGGRGYGFHCYGIPIKSVWRWDDDPRTVPKSNPATGKVCDDENIPGYESLNSCNVAACPYYGFATDVESISNSNPTVRLPIICSDTATDISQCQPMTWKVVDHFYNCYGGSTDTKEQCEAKSFLGVTDKHDQLWGWATIFESHDNGHYWRLYLNHYEKTVNIGIGSIFHASLEQADTIGYIPADNYVKHVHIELVMDDKPVRPDFLCDGSAGQPPINSSAGWVAKVTGANNLIATTNAEYQAAAGQGQTVCSWMDNAGHDAVTVATNANFWGYIGSTKSPRGPASYQNDPIGHSLDPDYELWTIYIDGGSTRLAPAETTTVNHDFAVSGTPLLVQDGTKTPIPNQPEWLKKVNRVGLGFVGNTYYLVFLQNASVADLQNAFVNLGGKNAINLDGGSKASLCSRSGGEVQKIVSQGAAVPVSIGFINGTIQPYSPTTSLAPTPPSHLR